MAEVTLREVRDDDLPALFAHQADGVGAAMAGLASRDQPAFDQHWAKIRTDPDTIVRTIVYGDEVAGNAVSFLIHGHREIGYWIDQALWGKGIASAAVALMLQEETRRPLYGHIITTNAGSRR